MITDSLFNTVVHRALLGLGVALLVACAGQQVQTPELTSLPAMPTETGALQPDTALQSVSTPELLALDDEMRAFIDRYVRHGDQRQRLLTLHRSMLSPAMVGIQYDPSADGTAIEAYHRGAANCLSYAHLFIAMARYAGLDARYLSVSIRPEWQRHGDQVALRRHVSIWVKLRSGEQYVIDIDPVRREQVAATDVLKDREAHALYHANIAMEELLGHRYGRAYAQSLRSLQLAGDIDYLWTNLGAIYRHAGEDAGAEYAYKTALSLNDDSRSAMNNLAVLYSGLGDSQQAEYWAQRVERHRQRNPYYAYYLGSQAEAAGETEQAISHFQRAIQLKDSDAEFYFRLAKLYHATRQTTLSIQYAQEAVARSRLVGEREEYEAFLKRVNGASLASVDTAGLPR